MSVGIIVGFFIGGIKLKLGKKAYSDKQIEFSKKCIRQMASILKYITFMLLVVGFIWCAYFLVLGIIMPQQSGYANNMAELIVAVLTVISIIFAFVEFVRRTEDKE